MPNRRNVFMKTYVIWILDRKPVLNRFFFFHYTSTSIWRNGGRKTDVGKKWQSKKYFNKFWQIDIFDRFFISFLNVTFLQLFCNSNQFSKKILNSNINIWNLPVSYCLRLTKLSTPQVILIFILPPTEKSHNSDWKLILRLELHVYETKSNLP